MSTVPEDIDAKDAKNIKNDMIYCPCGGELNLDLEETRKNGIIPVYNCSKCDNLLILQKVGERPRGWRTKKKLDGQYEMTKIPF